MMDVYRREIFCSGLITMSSREITIILIVTFTVKLYTNTNKNKNKYKDKNKNSNYHTTKTNNTYYPNCKRSSHTIKSPIQL